MAAWIFAKSKVHVFLRGNRVEAISSAPQEKREKEREMAPACVCDSAVCVRAKLPICSAFAARRGSPFGAEIVLLHGHLESLFTMMRLRLAVTPKTPMRYTSHSLFGSSNAPFPELQTSG